MKKQLSKNAGVEFANNGRGEDADTDVFPETKDSADILQENTMCQKPRIWQGIPGIEKTAKGRLFVTWFSGGAKEPEPENTIYLCTSDDGGQTFTEPAAVVLPAGQARAFDPALWIDPPGKLWLIFNRGDETTGVHGVHARICAEPDATVPVWGEEFSLGLDTPYSFRMNKPTVLSTGEWVLPVTHCGEKIFAWFAEEKQRQGVAISKDQGKSWSLHGSLDAPAWALENMIVERRNGLLWMLIRSGGGFLRESESTDRGCTWSEAVATTIANPGSRFFIRRLRSGNLLLVNHYKFEGRSHLTAQLSTDEGHTWNEGLLLDERAGVSYPDGIEDTDGLIRIVYDRNRGCEGDILTASFTEEDVAAGADVSGKVIRKQVINTLENTTLLESGWDPQKAANHVLEGLVRVTGPEVQGAHDAEFVCIGNHAFIVTMANDERPGEHPAWPFVYITLSVVHLPTLTVEKRIPMVRSEQVFENATLPAGACFVPRILRKDEQTLRCYFSSGQPGEGQTQTWFIDFDLEKLAFSTSIHRAMLKTMAGILPMQPRHFFDDAVAHGFKGNPSDHALYIIDSFKVHDGKTCVGINNFDSGHNALAVLNENFDTFEIVGHFTEPQGMFLTENAINRMPDGTWMAICRQDAGDRNYAFATSKDGILWTPAQSRAHVPDGTNSKPVFERLRGAYYLGWQEASEAFRCVFNIDISRDGKTWERKYHFESEKSFQYPSIHEHNSCIWLTVTQGGSDPSGKEMIMFGKME